MDILNTIKTWASNIVKSIKERTIKAGKGIRVDYYPSGSIISLSSDSSASPSSKYVYDGPFAISIKKEENEENTEENKDAIFVKGGYATFSTYVELLDDIQLPLPEEPEDDSIIYIYVSADYDSESFFVQNVGIEVSPTPPDEGKYGNCVLLGRILFKSGEYTISQDTFGEPHLYYFWGCTDGMPPPEDGNV